MKNYIFVLLFLSPVFANSQDSILTIRSIDFAVYDPASVESKIKVFWYCSINKNGSFKFQYGEGAIEVYSGKLTTEIITSMNKQFLPGRGLKDCYKTGMPDSHAIYEFTDFNYVRLVDENGKIESASFIDRFMKKTFLDIMSEIDYHFRSLSLPVDMKATPIITSSISKKITALHVKMKYYSSSKPPAIQEFKKEGSN